MNKNLSLHLDLLRFSAALLVLFSHARYARYDGGWIQRAGIGSYGLDAVMIFFVLSGFVIAYVSTHKELTIGDYTKSRLARLYSVALPALILTLLFDSIGKQIDPSIYMGAHYQNSDPVSRFLANAFFINEVWFTSIRPFSNGPFWSLSYEFWYYMIFACFLYFKGWRRFLLTSTACLIAGPKILILFPVWLLGVLTYHITQKVTFNTFASVCLIVFPCVLYFVYREMGWHMYLMQKTIAILGKDFVTDLLWSRQFINGYILGILISAHIIGVSSFRKKIIIPQAIEKTIRYLAGISFALYLLHYPLLQLYGSIFENGVIILSLTLLSIAIIAPVTEGKKKSWRNFIDRVLPWREASGKA